MGRAKTPDNPGFSSSTTMKNVLAIANDLIQQLGYNALIASNAADALETLYRNQDVSVLFSDIGMPDMNGEELARAAVAVRPGLRVILTSGDARRPTIAVTFVPKPYRSNDLIDILGFEILPRPFLQLRAKCLSSNAR
jgi:DNA-binding NtrC family response regulator